tara:strand:- start:6595 stop:8427 length:1833 start_codon:yes stop_codon:yes gene_type:complete
MSANAPADLSAPPASGPIVPSLNGAIPNNLPPSSFIGCQLGNFRLVEMIGQGGFGTVYRAEHIYMQQSFAIKIIHNHQQHHNEILQRFQREARTMARLEHSNIVQLKDFGHLGEHGFYIVMEYLKGISLRDAIEREFPLSIARTKTIFQQICSALEYTHQKGIFHRDLKPSNILLLKEPGAATADTVKIIDFGIASVSEEDSQLTQTGMLLGSVPYISPEQVRGIKKFINGSSDLYSLGILLYLVLTRRLPFKADQIAGYLTHHLFTPPPSLKSLRPGQVWSSQLDAFMAKAIAKEASERFTSAADFWRELDKALDTQPEIELAAIFSQDTVEDEPPLQSVGAKKTDESDSSEGDVVPEQEAFLSGAKSLLYIPEEHEVEELQEEDIVWGHELTFGPPTQTGVEKYTVPSEGSLVGILMVTGVMLLLGGVVGSVVYFAFLSEDTQQGVTRVIPLPPPTEQGRKRTKPPLETKPQTLPLPTKQKNPIFGAIRILTVPEGAYVYASGKILGVTPLTMKGKVGTQRTIQLRADGYVPQSLSWTFRVGQNKTLFQMVKKPEKQAPVVRPVGTRKNNTLLKKRRRYRRKKTYIRPKRRKKPVGRKKLYEVDDPFK